MLALFNFQHMQAQFSCAGLNTTPVNYTGGPQTFIVPAGVSQVRVSITGASGGNASGVSNMAGGGATVYAYINVVQGDVLRFIIGQQGVSSAMQAGGGGSSAVYKNGVLIMVAGAGGGEDNTGNGGNGQASEDGGSVSDSGAGGSNGCGSSALNGQGGVGGAGGNHGEFSTSCPHGGGGGGGLLSPGQGNGNINAGQPGGQGNINGALGGAGSLDDAVGVNGGWGWSGGGGADYLESGGGAGYSGGGGGPESRNPAGGGSFVAPNNTNGITESGKTNGTGTNAGYDGYGSICSPVVMTLPVNFSGFTAQKKSNGILLKWTTANETNTAYFQVEKSENGITFTSIGRVTAAGNVHETKEYSLTDNITNSGKVYYRIKVVDFDGMVTYSAVNIVNTGIEEALSIFPNPATERITVTLPNNWQGQNNRLQIIAANGQVLIEKNITLLQNDLNISTLSTGMYLIQVVNGKTKRIVSTRFVVRVK